MSEHTPETVFGEHGVYVSSPGEFIRGPGGRGTGPVVVLRNIPVNWDTCECPDHKGDLGGPSPVIPNMSGLCDLVKEGARDLTWKPESRQWLITDASSQPASSAPEGEAPVCMTRLVSSPDEATSQPTAPVRTAEEQAELAAVACLSRLDMSEGDRGYYVKLLAEPILAAIHAYAAALNRETIAELQPFLEIGKRDLTNPKYDSYWSGLRSLLSKLQKGVAE